MTRALAPPPPLQTPATPIFAFLTSKTDVRVVTIRAPELNQSDLQMRLPSEWVTQCNGTTENIDFIRIQCEDL